MSEELENKGTKKESDKEIKKSTSQRKTQGKTSKRNTSHIETTPKKTQKQASTDKKDVKKVTAEYKYEPKEGEKLITDKPSTPLKKIQKNEVKAKPTPKTNGQIYEAYVKELKNFKLVYNGDIIYDSSLSTKNSNLNFEADYFVLFGKKYSYNGLRIHKI